VTAHRPAPYDANGDRTQRTVGSAWLSYTYDAENQLTSAATDTYSTPTGSRWRSDYVYDGRGRLRKRVDYTWNTYPPGSWQVSGEIRHVYDGMRVIQERNSANTPNVSYTRGNDLSGTLEGAGGIGGMLARSEQYNSGSWGRHAAYYAAGNGNITALMGTTQTLLAAYRYDPYGRSLYQSGTLANANTYRFSSKDCHPNSGLYYYGFRFYEPGLQRWINRDPIGIRGGLNLFAYARNEPVVGKYPFGLWPRKCADRPGNGTAGYVACDGKGNWEAVNCFPGDRFSACVDVHEASHLKDVQGDLGVRTACQGMPRGWNPTDEWGGEWDVFWCKSEAKAHTAQKECLVCMRQPGKKRDKALEDAITDADAGLRWYGDTQGCVMRQERFRHERLIRDLRRLMETTSNETHAVR
jgi:RHS repeat-associated protein